MMSMILVMVKHQATSRVPNSYGSKMQHEISGGWRQHAALPPLSSATECEIEYISIIRCNGWPKIVMATYGMSIQTQLKLITTEM
mmetsp:Transcript_24815/g.69031  ORF Transcript_24815/g.69031 Transcript_24815/m.69031 type:complete len:85 (+) Transcript_24815:1098-1352(+)